MVTIFWQQVKDANKVQTNLMDFDDAMIVRSHGFGKMLKIFVNGH